MNMHPRAIPKKRSFRYVLPMRLYRSLKNLALIRSTLQSNPVPPRRHIQKTLRPRQRPRRLSLHAQGPHRLPLGLAVNAVVVQVSEAGQEFR